MDYRKLFWWLLTALILFTAGSLVGTGMTANSIKRDCLYLNKFRVNNNAYECKPDFSYLNNKPKEAKK